MAWMVFLVGNQGVHASTELNCLCLATKETRVSNSLTQDRAVGAKGILLLRVDFSDLAGDPFDDAHGLTLLTNAQEFFEQTSYSTMTIKPPESGSDLSPTIRLPRTATYYGTNNLFSQLRADALNEAALAGYDVASYDFDVVAMGLVPGFNWTGLGIINGKGAFLRGRFDTYTLVHELGHNLGLNHASSWEAGPLSSIGSGIAEEYGDRFDVMGTGVPRDGFNSRYRSWLGWLDETSITNLMFSSRIVLRPFDDPEGAGLRGARIVRSAGFGNTNYYHLGYRMDSGGAYHPGNLELHWVGNANQSSLLLDMTPGSPPGMMDAPLELGRTFSDPEYGIHITPVGLFSSPVSGGLEVVHHRGAFPDNLPPELTLEISAGQVDPDEEVRLVAVARDPEGGEMAFHWNLRGGGDTFNQSEISACWDVPGEYVVDCTVTDMKGGVARRSIRVQVGNPDVWSVAGQVLTSQGDPLAGVILRINGDLAAVSGEEGHFQVANLLPNLYSLTAEREGYEILPVDGSSLIGGPPSLISKDYIAQPRSGEVINTLVARSSAWKFLDDGSDPGPDWMQPGYPDFSWPVGLAQLGYGDGDENTLLDFGPFPNFKHVSYYFRQTFQVPDPSQIAALRLGLNRDDGAAVFLNGTEVVRENLPSGTLDYQTLALFSIGGLQELPFLQFQPGPSLLRHGTNWLAVEVHQEDEDSADLSFDLWLQAEEVRDLVPGIYLNQPISRTRFEESGNITLWAAATRRPVADLKQVQFFAQDRWIGESLEPPHSMEWSHVPLGTYSLTARAYYSDGITFTSSPVVVHVDRALIRRGESWRYRYDGIDLGESWRQPGYDDSSWQSGHAQLGYGDGDESTVLSFGSDPVNKPITAYFRKAFQVEDALAVENLHLRLLRDDGAVVYLNGEEIWRSNMPSGSIFYDTFAATSAGRKEEGLFFEAVVPASSILTGTNWLAVEVHQRSSSSSDLSFDMECIAQGLPRSDVIPALVALRIGDWLQLKWANPSGQWCLQSSSGIGDGADWDLVSEEVLHFPEYSTTTVVLSEKARYFRLERFPLQP